MLCLPRVLGPQRADPKRDFATIEKHDLIYLARGGHDDYENLLLVCANCHKKIHHYPACLPLRSMKIGALAALAAFKLPHELDEIGHHGFKDDSALLRSGESRVSIDPRL